MVRTPSIALSLALLSGPAHADRASDFTLNVGGWKIAKGEETCVATSTYEGNGSTELALVTSEPEYQISLSVANYGWHPEIGETIDLVYRTDGFEYSIKALAYEIQGRKGFIGPISSVLKSDIASSHSLSITLPDGTLVDSLSLTGSARAIEMLDKCKALAMHEYQVRKANEDRLSHIPEDPFARQNREQSD